MSQARSDESTVKSTVSPMPRDHDRLLYWKKRRENSSNSYMCACEHTCRPGPQPITGLLGSLITAGIKAERCQHLVNWLSEASK